MNYGQINLKEPPDEAFIIINKGQSGLSKAMEFFGGNIFSSKNKAKAALKELEKLEELDEFNPKSNQYENCEIRKILVFEAAEKP